MEDFKETDIYEKEHKIRDQLKEELVFIIQNNLKNTVEKYEQFTEMLLAYRFTKKREQMRELAAKIPKKGEKPRNDKESKKIKANLENEQINLQESSKYIKENIQNHFDKIFNEDLKKLQNGIDEIFNTDGINKNVKNIYHAIKNDDYSVEKINENHKKTMEKFEEVYQEYLLKNLKYKEELAVYNKRQEQIQKENIDIKKEYNDINNFLDNFQVDNKEKEKLRRLDELIDSL